MAKGRRYLVVINPNQYETRRNSMKMITASALSTSHFLRYSGVTAVTSIEHLMKPPAKSGKYPCPLRKQGGDDTERGKVAGIIPCPPLNGLDFHARGARHVDTASPHVMSDVDVTLTNILGI